MLSMRGKVIHQFKLLIYTLWNTQYNKQCSLKETKDFLVNKLCTITITYFTVYPPLSFLAYNSLVSADLNLILKGLKQLRVM